MSDVATRVENQSNEDAARVNPTVTAPPTPTLSPPAPPEIEAPPVPDYDRQMSSHLDEILAHVPELDRHPDLALGIAASDSPDKIGLAQGAALTSYADSLPGVLAHQKADAHPGLWGQFWNAVPTAGQLGHGILAGYDSFDENVTQPAAAGVSRAVHGVGNAAFSTEQTASTDLGEGVGLLHKVPGIKWAMDTQTQIGIDELGATGWTVNHLQDAYDSATNEHNRLLGGTAQALGASKGQVQQFEHPYTPPVAQQLNAQFNNLMETPQRTYRYLSVVEQRHGAGAAAAAAAPMIAAGLLAGLATRGGGGEAAPAIEEGGIEAANAAAAGFESTDAQALAQEGVTPAIRDGLVNSRTDYYRNLGLSRGEARFATATENVGRALGTPIRAARLAGDALASPQLLASEGTINVSGHILYPKEWELAADPTAWSKATGRPGTLGNFMFQWLPDGGAKTALQDVANFATSFALPDPIGAAGRTAAIARSADGFGGVLGHFWGGTSMDQAVEAYDHYPTVRRAVDFIATRDSTDVLRWRPELADSVERFNAAKVYRGDGEIDREATVKNLLKFFADDNEAALLTRSSTMPMRGATDFFRTALRDLPGFKLLTKTPMLQVGEAGAREWSNKEFAIGDANAIEPIMRALIQTGTPRSVAKLVGEKLVASEGDPLMWRQVVGNAWRHVFIAKMRSRLGAELADRLSALGDNTTLAGHIGAERFVGETISWDQKISNAIDGKVRDLIETPFSARQGEYAMGIGNENISRISEVGVDGSRAAAVYPEQLNMMQLPNYHEFDTAANKLVKDLGIISRKEMKINGISLFKDGKAYRYYAGDWARDFINNTVNRYFRTLALLTGGWAIRVSMSETFLNILRQGGIKTIAAHFAASTAEHEYQLVQDALVAVRRGVASDSEEGRVIADTASHALNFFKDHGYPVPAPKEMTHFVAALTTARLALGRAVVQSLGEKELLEAASTLIYANDGHITGAGLSASHRGSYIDIDQHGEAATKSTIAGSEGTTYAADGETQKAALSSIYREYGPGDPEFVTSRFGRANFVRNSRWGRPIMGAYADEMERSGSIANAFRAAQDEARRLIDEEGAAYKIFDRAHNPPAGDQHGLLNITSGARPRASEYESDHEYQQALDEYRNHLKDDHANVLAHDVQGLVLGPAQRGASDELESKLVDGPLGRQYYDKKLAEDIRDGTTPRAPEEFRSRYHGSLTNDVFNRVSGPVVNFQSKFSWAKPSNLFNGIQSNFLGKLVNRLSRDPTYIVDFARERAQFADAVARGTMTQDAADTIAQSRAFSKMTRFIHNPLDKTKFDEMARVVAPFYFAQMQAWRRVGRLFAENPGAFEQYMKIMLGAQQGIHKIATGNNGLPEVTIPGTTWLDAHLVGVPLGLMANLDVLRTIMPLPYTEGEGSASASNLAAAVVPQFGPVVTVPAKMLENWAITDNFHPALAQSVGRVVLGNVGETSPLWTEFLPNSVLDHIVELGVGYGNDSPAATGGNHGLFENVTSSYISTQLQVLIQRGNAMSKSIFDKWDKMPAPPGGTGQFTLDEWRYENAAGEVMAKFEDTKFRNEFIADANQATAGLWAIKTLAGAFSPVSLSTGDADPGIQKLYNELLVKNKGNTLQADDELLTMDPWATFSVTPQSFSGASPIHKSFAYPETDAALNYIIQNEGLVHKYSTGMAFLIPQAAASGPYSSWARDTQIMLGLRTRDLPADFVNAAWYAIGQNVVYNVFDKAADREIADGESPYIALYGNGRTEPAGRETWINQYGNYYSPTWLSYNRSEASKSMRQAAMNQFEAMADDPAFKGQTVNDWTVRVLNQLSLSASNVTYKDATWWNGLLDGMLKGNFPDGGPDTVPPPRISKAVGNQLTYAVESVFRPLAPLNPGN